MKSGIRGFWVSIYPTNSSSVHVVRSLYTYVFRQRIHPSPRPLIFRANWSVQKYCRERKRDFQKEFRVYEIVATNLAESWNKIFANFRFDARSIRRFFVWRCLLSLSPFFRNCVNWIAVDSIVVPGKQFLSLLFYNCYRNFFFSFFSFLFFFFFCFLFNGNVYATKPAAYIFFHHKYYHLDPVRGPERTPSVPINNISVGAFSGVSPAIIAFLITDVIILSR